MNVNLNKPTELAAIGKDADIIEIQTNSSTYARLGWIVVAVFVGVFIIWASVAPLDKGVPLSGSVAKESNRKAVQHLTGGTIDEILVKDGAQVKAGQVLVRMNATLAKSNAEISRSQLLSEWATEARMLAERDGKASITFPANLLAAKDDPRASSAMRGQELLFSSRKMALQNELGAVDENIAGLRQQIKGIEESRESKKEQLAILKEQLTNMRELAKEGYVPRTQLLDLERTYAQINGAISEDMGNLGRARAQVLEMSLRRSQRMQEFQRDLRTQLSDVQKEVTALANRYAAQEFELKNTEVRAPVDGIVVGMNVFTRGGVVSPGFRMMDLVPTDDALIVEGQLAVNLIDKVHPGLPVDLIFSAFNTNKTPHIPGEVLRVAADRMVDEKTGVPYYPVKARVTAEGLKLIAKQKLEVRPGMPVDMFVKTGERTMMSYLFKPVFDRAHSSLSEE